MSVSSFFLVIICDALNPVSSFSSLSSLPSLFPLSSPLSLPTFLRYFLFLVAVFLSFIIVTVIITIIFSFLFLNPIKNRYTSQHLLHPHAPITLFSFSTL